MSRQWGSGQFFVVLRFVVPPVPVGGVGRTPGDYGFVSGGRGGFSSTVVEDPTCHPLHEVPRNRLDSSDVFSSSVAHQLLCIVLSGGHLSFTNFLIATGTRAPLDGSMIAP